MNLHKLKRTIARKLSGVTYEQFAGGALMIPLSQAEIDMFDFVIPEDKETLFDEFVTTYSDITVGGLLQALGLSPFMLFTAMLDGSLEEYLASKAEAVDDLLERFAATRGNAATGSVLRDELTKHDETFRSEVKDDLRNHAVLQNGSSAAENARKAAFVQTQAALAAKMEAGDELTTAQKIVFNFGV